MVEGIRFRVWGKGGLRIVLEAGVCTTSCMNVYT